jgi:hypothetical protein
MRPLAIVVFSLFMGAGSMSAVAAEKAADKSAAQLDHDWAHFSEKKCALTMLPESEPFEGCVLAETERCRNAYFKAKKAGDNAGMAATCTELPKK